MNYFAECLTRFQSLDTITRETFGSVETYISIKEIEDKYKIKLSFLVILIALGEIEEEDIEDYLIIKFKLSSTVAKNAKEEIVEKILDPVLEKIIDTKPINNFVASKEDIINLFSKRVIETLKSSPEVIQGLNFLIFKLSNEHDDLEEKIIELLYKNEEILTGGKLVIEDREVSPTVANWLKDFIKVNGSNIFDELTLAQYLTNSANVKKLKPGEKDLLRKLLKLYRNLAFFPESMENIPIEDWQIIPVSYEEIALHQSKKKKELVESRDVLSDKKEVIAKEEPIVKKEVAAKEAKPIVEEAKPIDELENILTSYKPGTLEHKAVTQEIGRLNKKSKK
jgi:hypothetical protein